MAKMLSQAAFARKHRKSRSWANALIKAGVVRLIDGKINSQEAEIAIKANIDSRTPASKPKSKPRKKSSPHQPDGGNGVTLTEARRNSELLKGELLALRLQLETGDLVRRDQILQIYRLLVAEARAAFLGLPRRMAETLAGISDAKEIESLLRIEIYRILDGLTRGDYMEMR